MTVSSLREIFFDHEGKVSDKWEVYLDVYSRTLHPFRDLPVRLLEIGVQNGGSLEIWGKYFLQATALVGCDINPACGSLKFDDSRIRVVTGDACLDSTLEEITRISPTFDVIIDDGSHLSKDIVRSFARYFPALQDGGVYVAEDLHCSYWREFGGGLFDPNSSMSFFKRLADITNFESWGVPQRRTDLLQSLASSHGVVFEEHELAQVHSVEFVNSMCVVRKAAAASNLLGSRIAAGIADEVLSQDKQAVRDTSNFPSQITNRWSQFAHLDHEADAGPEALPVASGYGPGPS